LLPAPGGEADGDTLTDIEILIGSSHADTLTGNAGHNTLNAGLGGDVLTGGAGFDAFDFNAALGAANVDRITDFSAADDVVRLDDAVFTGLGTGALSAAAFAAGTAASEADDRIIYDSGTGALYYDADGTGAIVQVQFATLTSRPGGVTSADFLVL
jgi:serralysin